MTREQQLECLEIIAKTFDLEIFVQSSASYSLATQQMSLSWAKFKDIDDFRDETITLHWAHHPDNFSEEVFFDRGSDRFPSGRFLPHNCTCKSLDMLLRLVSGKQLLCRKFYDNDKNMTPYEFYRNAYVPSFSSPEELRLKLAINGNKS